jgi:hypothetical protein
MATNQKTRVDTHRRYQYSAISDRPAYEWPGGKRLALHLSLNIEHFRFGADWGMTMPFLSLIPI